MANTFYKFPESTIFDRIVPKEKIYKVTSADSKLQRLFIDQIERIKWTHKLAPETVNIAASPSVKEIQVFTLLLKTGELSDSVLSAIDLAIPSPILFILKYDSKIRYRAAYKRPNAANSKKSVLSAYFGATDFVEYNEKTAQSLPAVLNLAKLYEAFLRQLIPLQKRKEESLEELILRFETIKKLKKTAGRMEKKIHTIKQFNRRVELNEELKKIQKDIQQLES